MPLEWDGRFSKAGVILKKTYNEEEKGEHGPLGLVGGLTSTTTFQSKSNTLGSIEFSVQIY